MTRSATNSTNWSRSFNGATATSPWMTIRDMWSLPGAVKLQWGHGDFAVDDIRCRATSRTSLGRFNGATATSPWMTAEWNEDTGTPVGFNGATATSPWMTGHSLWQRCLARELQWGHGDFAVDDAP